MNSYSRGKQQKKRLQPPFPRNAKGAVEQSGPHQ